MDTVLGLLGLLVYITFVLSLSSAVTFAVVKLSPAQSAKTPPTES
jgi:hypothetical protein